MADYNVSRPGQVNLAGDALALFLKVWSGEVLTAFESVNVTMDKHTVRTIASGKQASFPAFGKITAHYHQVGTELVGTKMAGNEVLISIDDLLVSDVSLAKIDEAMAHFDYRSPITIGMGRALSKQMDTHVLQQGLLAARASNVITGLPGGSIVYEGTADFLADGVALAKGLFEAATILDEKDVPDEDRYAYVRPRQYAALVQNTDLINKDIGGAGVYSENKVWKVAGLTIVKTNNLPNTVVANSTVAAGTGNKYAGDFSKTAALVMTKEAVGTVKLLDMATETEYSVGKQGNLFVSKYAVGHGVLRPECAVELRADVAP
jgi:hypothetical protein